MPLSVLLLFQFHKGTIKTRLTRFVNKDSIIFQFHKGTIKTELHHANPYN